MNAGFAPRTINRETPPAFIRSARARTSAGDAIRSKPRYPSLGLIVTPTLPRDWLRAFAARATSSPSAPPPPAITMLGVVAANSRPNASSTEALTPAACETASIGICPWSMRTTAISLPGRQSIH